MKYPLCEHIFFTTEIVNSKFIKYVLKIFLKEQSENIFKINEKVFLKMMGAGKDLLGVEEENTQMWIGENHILSLLCRHLLACC